MQAEECNCTLTNVVRLHSLQSEAIHGPALEVDLPLLSDYPALGTVSRPKDVTHRAPRSLRIRSVVTRPVLSTHEARRCPCNLHIHQSILIGGRLDGVVRSIFGKLDREAVGVKGVLVLIEAVVLEWTRRPEEGLLVVWVVYFDVELGGDAQTAMRDKREA